MIVRGRFACLATAAVYYMLASVGASFSTSVAAVFCKTNR